MPRAKEAVARIKINRLLEEAGWRFLDEDGKKANVRLEASLKMADLGDDFENAESTDKRRGAADFLLLDAGGRALAVLEAKRAGVNPLTAKDQARDYARSSGVHLIILSNGDLHYLWDTEAGNPEVITRFPTPDSITQFKEYHADLKALAGAAVDENYIIASQMPGFAVDPDWDDTSKRVAFIEKHDLRQLRPYQLAAVQALQRAAGQGQTRYLFEMATGTGKTLTAAAVIRLFLKSGNARRVLFLVDRLELERQAKKSFKKSIGHDFTVKVFKEDRESWQNAEIVVTTVQSLLAGDRYKREFSPTDFELVISDEAHRSIGGNSRAVFEYFVGYKLGLTATPKDYLRGTDQENADTVREMERRQLLDTYRTFGCASGEPTFRYDLLDGVKDKVLVNPLVVDARTEITTELLSEQGYAAPSAAVAGEESGESETFFARDYERRLFNEDTNRAMCQAFLEYGLVDPVTVAERAPLFGKSIVFCISQNHAAKVTQHLNELAASKWPVLYGHGSDFAVQVTSLVQNAQKMTEQFANDALGGTVSPFENYVTSRARVAVTVGMMTTGYDCSDLLNLALMRPVFSPSDFIQMKGRGTRRHTFKFEPLDGRDRLAIAKTGFKLFDFFAVCQYFDHEFNYDEKIALPKPGPESSKATEALPQVSATGLDDEPGAKPGPTVLNLPDAVATLEETAVGPEGMFVDRAAFRRALDEDIVSNDDLKRLWEQGNAPGAEALARDRVFDRPKYFLNPEKVRRLFGLDRRPTVHEILEFAFGARDRFDTRDELLEGEWNSFVGIAKPEPEQFNALKSAFKAYLTDQEVQKAMDPGNLTALQFTAGLHFSEYEAAGPAARDIPMYVKNYLNREQFTL